MQDISQILRFITFNTTSASFVVVALGCGIQFGGNGLASVGFLAFIILWFRIGASSISIPAVAFSIAALSLSLLQYIDSELFADYFPRTAREALVLSSWISLTARRVAFANTQPLASAALLIQAFCIILAIFQAITFVAGHPVGFLPYSLYGSIADLSFDGDQAKTTIPSYWLEFGDYKSLILGEDIKIRPVAFFAEPSYLSFILLASAVIIDFSQNQIKIRVIGYIAAILGSLLCQSGSGFIASITLAMLSLKDNIPRRYIYPVVAVGAACSATLILYVFGDRILGSTDLTLDMSGFIRIVMPLVQIERLANEGAIFGISPGAYLDRLDPTYRGLFVGHGTDNGVFNLIISYGLSGLMILMLLPFILGPRLAIIVLVLAQFNGGILGFDKGAIIGLLIILFNSKPPHKNI